MMNSSTDNIFFAEEASALKGKNMIAVVSGQCNSGKTWFSITLANDLSLLKQRVLIFDADNGLNNIKAQLGINHITDLDNVIYQGYSLNQIISFYDKGRFDIIAGNAYSSGLTTMSIGRLQILGDDLNIVSQNYDKTILDIKSGLGNVSKVLTGMAKTSIVVCGDDPQSITDNYELIKHISSHYPKTSIKIVINQVNNVEDGLRAYSTLVKACEEFLKISPPLLGVVRQDTRVRDSIRTQSIIVNRYPQSEASLDVMAIAKRILNNEQLH